MAERIVSKKELEDFKSKFGQNMELRDLLNKERGLTRRKSKPITKDVDENIKGMPMSKAESEDVASRLYKPSGRLNSQENMETSDMAYNKKGQGVPDFVLMTEISEDAMMQNLTARYKADEIYVQNLFN